ncbi:sensor histidine kinase [Solihabitans fulvus]|uniref:histidine kinase n=1 Tax=Solihabitans fulvus TaxID=1892852 RepID=A0A5B2XDD6_9PSEU|nr:sensor domain-containing protein [Solihabitans fulvus]KAA2261353.1 sensor histidine kinase [Solihabitans fulvus]
MTELARPDRRPGVSTAVGYFLLNFPLALTAFCALVPLTAVGFGTVVVWVGIPILMLATLLWRAAAISQRALVRASFGVDIESPYRSLPAGSILRKWRAQLGDPATWRDLAYGLVNLPLSVLEFSATIALWAGSIGFVVEPIIGPLLPRNTIQLPTLGFNSDTVTVPLNNFSDGVPYLVLGIVGIFLAVTVTAMLRRLRVALATSLLGPTNSTLLGRKADHLQASRARGVDSAEAERRRIERDLHDGAQQRLVSVAMELGRAKAKFDTDPDGTKTIIDEAHADAKLAIAELRDLARGIYPAVLGDRGLDAALSALAAKASVPVTVLVNVEPRPPAAVESTAYFVVAESLTNIAKHAEATQAEVLVCRMGDSVLVEITDNGRGGADTTAGSGLTGLADRAAAIDGVLSVHSPAGGPTTVRALLPCEW